jgi:ubiquinone/menaquinone biosynthesis C-methylase UbiE
MATEAAQSAPVTPEHLMQMMQGMQATAILQAGIRLGVFDQIADGKDDVTSIAAGIGADERGTRILLDALAALGVLAKDGAYRLSPAADAFLVSGRPTYLGAMTDIMAGKWAWEAFPRLEEAVRRGGTILDQDAEVPGHVFWETFARASVGVAAPASYALAEALKPWAQERETLEILDVACGSGLFGLTLAAQYPQASVTLLDWSNVLALTGENVKQMGLEGRTSFIEGDVFDVDLRGPYDLILASHIFHHFSEPRCGELMRRMAGALKPDGLLAIHEFTSTGQSPADEPFPALFSVIMLAWTREGEAYPLDTYERLLAQTGFGAPEVNESMAMPSRFLIAALAGA